MLNQMMGGSGGGVPPGVNLTDGLVAHYLLNNNTDDSHGTYDGTPSGGVDFQGDMAKFDGVDDYIDCGLIATIIPNSFTLSLWFTTPPSFGVAGVMFNGRNYDYRATKYLLKGYMRVASTGVLDMLLRNNANTWSGSESTKQLAVSTLYNIVYTWDETTSTQKVYLDGIILPNYTKVGTGDFEYVDGKFNIGRHVYLDSQGPTEFSNSYFTDNISNVRVYNEVKDQTFIDVLYAEGYYPKPLPLPTTDGLVAHYPLTGTAEDAHGEGGNESGVEYNGVAFVDDVERGSVASFDGVDDYINQLSVSPPQNITMSCWAKVNQDNGDIQYIISQGGDVTGNKSRGIVFTDNTVIFVSRDASGGYVAFNYPMLNAEQTNYHNYTLTQEGVSLKAYVDGVLVGTVSTVTQFTFNTDIHIGRVPYSTATPYWFNGQVSDLRIYDRALITTEVTALYDEVDEPTDGLVAHYPLTKEWRANDAWVSYDGTEVNTVYADDGEFGAVMRRTEGTTVTNYINVDAVNQPRQNFTVCGWINKTVNNMAVYHDKNVLLSDAYFLVWDNRNGTGSYLMYDPVTVFPTVNKWTFFEVDSDLNIYLDRVLVGTANTASSSTFIAITANIGRLDGTIVDTLNNSKYKDFFIYNKVLSVQEREDIYNYTKNFRAIDIDDGLVAYYPLANNSLDNYRNQEDGLDTAVTYDGTNGVFNGTTSKVASVKQLTNAETQNSALSIWVTPSAIDVLGVPASMADGSSVSQLSLFVGADNFYKIQIRDLSVYNTATSTTVASVGVPVHLVGVVDGTNVLIYINGILEHSVPLTAINPTGIDNSHIGYRNYSNYGIHHYMHGKLAHYRIYNKAISAEQVEVIYNSEKGDFE